MASSNSVYNFDIASIQQVQNKIQSAIDSVILAKEKISDAYSYADERLKDAYSNKYNPSIYSVLSSSSTSESSATSILEKCITGGDSVISALGLVIGVEDTSALTTELSGINTETTVAADAVDTSTDGNLSDAVNAEIQEEVTAKWYDGYLEAWEKLKNFEIIDAIGAALSTLLKNVAATIAAAFTSLLAGVGSLVEGIVDATIFIGGGLASLVAWIWGKEAHDKVLDWTKSVVAYDTVQNLYDLFYSTRLGQDISENSVMDVNGTVATVLKETGRWAGILALNLIPGVGQVLSVAAAGVSGLGGGAQTALQNGSGYAGALLTGSVRGVIDLLMAGKGTNLFKGDPLKGMRLTKESVLKYEPITKTGTKWGLSLKEGTLGAKVVTKFRSIASKITKKTPLSVYNGFVDIGKKVRLFDSLVAAGVAPALVDTVVDKITDGATGGQKVVDDKQETNTVVDDTVDTENLPAEKPDTPIVDKEEENDSPPLEENPSKEPNAPIIDDNDPVEGEVESDPEESPSEIPGDPEVEGEQESGSIEVETEDSSEESDDDEESDGDEESGEETEEDGTTEDNEEEEEESGTSSAGPTCLECGKPQDECTCEKDEEPSEEPEEPSGDQDSETENPIISGSEELTGTIGPGQSVPEDYVEPGTSNGSNSGSSGSGTIDVETSTGTTETIEPPAGGTTTELGTIEVTTDNVGSGIEIGESESGMFTYNDHISGTALLDEITDDIVIGEGSSIIQGMDGTGQIDVITTTEYDHEAYEKARTSYENLGTEWHAKQENLILNEVEELYVTDQATLGEKLLAYGYSQEEVDTILQDKNMAYRAMIAGYDNSNIEKIRENFSQTPELADSVDVMTIIE